MRRIVRGCADGSYGVEVAKLAGIPDEVVRSARRILKELEQEGIQRPAAPKSDDDEPLSLTAGVTVQLIDELKAVDVNNLTPIEAMTKLDELSKRARSL